MLTGNEKNLPEAFCGKVPRFRDHLVVVQRHAQDRVIAREATIAAVVDALVRQIERRKEPHGAPEVLQGEGSRGLSEALELRIRFGRNQLLKLEQPRRLLERGLIKDGSERHGAISEASQCFATFGG